MAFSLGSGASGLAGAVDPAVAVGAVGVADLVVVAGLVAVAAGVVAVVAVAVVADHSAAGVQVAAAASPAGVASPAAAWFAAAAELVGHAAILRCCNCSSRAAGPHIPWRRISNCVLGSSHILHRPSRSHCTLAKPYLLALLALVVVAANRGGAQASKWQS